MFSQAKLLWIVSLHWARINFPTISKSCHCIMCKCLLWLKVEGQVQGLRSVTLSQCLPFITTLKTVTHPWFFFSFFFFFLNENVVLMKWWQKCTTTWHVDIVLTLTGLGKWRKGLNKIYQEEKSSFLIKFLLQCALIQWYCTIQAWEQHCNTVTKARKYVDTFFCIYIKTLIIV